MKLKKSKLREKWGYTDRPEDEKKHTKVMEKAERDYKDPEKRKKYTMSDDAVFMMTCDKVNAKIRIREDGTWEILDITGRHEPAYKKKKSYE